MFGVLEMAADVLADVRNGGLFGLLEMVSPAVQPLAPAFWFLGDDPLDRRFRRLNADGPRGHVPEKLRRSCRLLILRGGLGSMDDAPCLEDDSGAKGLGGKVAWRLSLVAAGLFVLPSSVTSQETASAARRPRSRSI